MKLPDNVLAALGGQLTTSAASIREGARLVPNEWPTVEVSDYRVAVIGEAPGADEDELGRPFCGASGRFLDSILTAEGMSRPTVFVGNVCNYRPPNNDLKAFEWSGPEVQSSLERLTQDLAKFNPNVIILLGRYALFAATGEFKSVANWRGSVFLGTKGAFAGRKCIATYHPAAVLRMYEWTPLLRFDIKRAKQEGSTPRHVVLERRFRTGLSISEILLALDRIGEAFDYAERVGQGRPELWVSFDLEGYWNRVTRFSLATSPTEGFIVPFTSGEFDSHWSTDDECRLWRSVARVLEDPRIPKVLQNSLYDRFVLAYQHKVLIRNVAYDTMLGHWELYCELPNNLGLQASIYTKEPYWKGDINSDSLEVRELYCCRDSAVTEEIRRVQTPLLLENSAIWNHFQFNLRLLNPVLYMELRGIKYDLEAAAKSRSEIRLEMWAMKHELNKIAGRTLNVDRAGLLAVCRERVCKKREAKSVITFGQLPSTCLKSHTEVAERLAELDRLSLLNDMSLRINETLLGELEYLLDVELNVDSPKQMIEWLYCVRKFDRQYKKKADGTEALSSDVMAMLNIYRKTKDPAPKLVLQIRSQLYKVEVLGIKADPDGRIRCGYNEVAAETGRIACYESPTGSGYNLQTVTKKLRYLFVADAGHWLAQCDLAGADGWTVAAHCSSLGDDFMLDDYRFGLKPARIIALMYQELERVTSTKSSSAPQAVAEISKHFNSLSRADLKTLCKSVDSDGWLYFASKRVQHGSNYGAQQSTISDIVLKDSYKFLGEPVFVEPRVCGLLQRLYLNRYVGIARWHARVGSTLLRHEKLVAASGRVRRFFGRLRDGQGVNHETFKSALSNEPQDNTTYATNLAMYRLWHDTDNRDSSRPSGLIVEPLHQVHDAIITQFPKECVEWAVKKHKEWFDNELVIAGVRLKIPYEGAYGRSWGELDQGVI